MEKKVEQGVIAHGQRDRISYTMGYKGIIIGGASEYHPEKMDVLVTRTIDHIPGESPEDTKARLEEIKQTEKLLVESVGATVAEKVNAIKKRFQNS